MEKEKYDELKYQFIKNYPHQVNNFSEQEFKMAQHNVWKMMLDNYFLITTPKIIHKETFKTFKNLFIKVCKLLQQNLEILEADLKSKLKREQLLINQNDNPEPLDLNNLKFQIKNYHMQLRQDAVNNIGWNELLTALGTQFSTITNEIQTPTKASISDLKTQIEILNHNQKMLSLLTSEIPSLFQELCSSNDFLTQENIIISSIKDIVTTSNNDTLASTNDNSSFSNHSAFINRLRI